VYKNQKSSLKYFWSKHYVTASFSGVGLSFFVLIYYDCCESGNRTLMNQEFKYLHNIGNFECI